MNDKPDHKKGQEAQREIKKVIDDRQKGRITREQMSNDIATLKENIRNDVVKPMQGRRD